MKANEIKEMTADELNTKLAELKEELFNLRFQHAVNQLENPKRLQAVKKDIRYMHYVLNQKQYRQYLQLLQATLVNRGLK